MLDLILFAECDVVTSVASACRSAGFSFHRNTSEMLRSSVTIHRNGRIQFQIEEGDAESIRDEFWTDVEWAFIRRHCTPRHRFVASYSCVRTTITILEAMPADIAVVIDNDHDMQLTGQQFRDAALKAKLAFLQPHLLD